MNDKNEEDEKKKKFPDIIGIAGSGFPGMGFSNEQIQHFLNREQERYEERARQDVKQCGGFLVDLGLGDLIVYLEQSIMKGIFFKDFLVAMLIKEVRELKEAIKDP